MDYPLASLEGLPDDVLAHVFELLDSKALAGLRVSRRMDVRVQFLGIPLYLAHNRLPLRDTDTETHDPLSRFYATARVSRAIARHDVYVGTLVRWPRTIPTMSLGAGGDTVAFGAGTRVILRDLDGNGNVVTEVDLERRRMRTIKGYDGTGRGGEGWVSTAPAPVTATATATVTAGRGQGRARAKPSSGSGADITGIHLLSSSSSSTSADLIVAQFDGMVERINAGRRVARYAHPHGVTALSGHAGMVLTVAGGSGSREGVWRSASASATASASASASASTSNSTSTSASASASPSPTPSSPPTARLFPALSPWIPATLLPLPSRAWSAHLSARGAFLGLRGGIHWYDATSPSSSTCGILRPLPSDDETATAAATAKSAAYGLVTRDDATLLSAWHDGVLRLHDLRTQQQVLAFSDPWSCAPLFSAAFTGAHGVVAGGGEHGVVHVWDVRFARASAGGQGTGGCGWTAFSPDGRGSPVYALAGDGARVYGATERRGFVLAFDAHPGTGFLEGDGAGLGQGHGHGRGHGRGHGDGRRRGSMTQETSAEDGVMGYRHDEGGMTLFQSRLLGV